MPLFQNNIIDILLIHIPKTGGTSIENYLSQKYNIPLDLTCVFSRTPYKGYYPQHYTYLELDALKNEFNISITENTKILTVVRNPYSRFISALIYNGFVTKDTQTQDMYNIIFKIFKYKNIPVHFLPQYKFIVKKDDSLLENVIILKTESLTKDMHHNGWNDFNVHANKGNYRPRYDELLDNTSIELIREFYKKDFELFDYPL